MLTLKHLKTLQHVSIIIQIIPEDDLNNDRNVLLTVFVFFVNCICLACIVVILCVFVYLIRICCTMCVLLFLL